MPQRRNRSARLHLERLESREVPAAVRPASAVVAPPTVPGNFAVTPLSDSQVRLSWADSARETGYRVYQWNGTAWAVAATTAADATSFVAADLTPGKRHYFYVAAFNSAGEASTDFLSIDAGSAPTKPGSLTAAAVSGTQARLSWADSLGEQGYRIFQWNGSSWGRVGDAAADATSFTASGLAVGRTYYFYVEAFNPAGTAATDFVSVVTAAPPAAPASFAVSALSGTQARLTWSDTAGEAGYRLYQWNGAAWAVLGTTGANATSFVAANLSPGKVHYFYVEAFNDRGAAATAFRSVVMPLVAPTVPPTFTATPLGGAQVRLTWADSARETGYRVYQWNGRSWVVVATTGANSTSFVATGLARFRAHSFYVEAFNATATAATNFVTVTAV